MKKIIISAVALMTVAATFVLNNNKEELTDLQKENLEALANINGAAKKGTLVEYPKREEGDIKYFCCKGSSSSNCSSAACPSKK